MFYRCSIISYIGGGFSETIQIKLRIYHKLPFVAVLLSHSLRKFIMGLDI